MQKDKNTVSTRFEYIPPIGGEHEVYLTGDFNDWRPQELKMNPEDGYYTITLELPKGKYAYKFIVDGKWITDESAKHFREDGFGDWNSVVIVGEETPTIHYVHFSYKSEEQAESLFLVGSFNDWDIGRDKMEMDEDGVYHITILLEEGKYHYKFFVDGKWLTDPQAKKLVDDGMGSQDAVIVVDDRFPALRSKRGNGEIHTYGIETRQTSRQISPISDSELDFGAKAYKNDVQTVYLILQGREYKMHLYDQNDVFEFYHIIVDSTDLPQVFSYYFIYQDGGKRIYLHREGFSEDIDEQKAFRFDKNDLHKMMTPDWAKHGIIYQIFCDRFCNGKHALNPDFSEWYYSEQNYLSEAAREGKYRFVKDWYDQKRLKEDENRHHLFYGGDLIGVEQKLEYLKGLGVDIIYFNPLVKAESNHKYDTIDYFTIDPHFGSNEDFKRLVEKFHAADIKVIVDFAFNHVGVASQQFQDSLQKGPDSKYYKWFEWKKWPIPKPLPDNFDPLQYYQCWWGHSTLPDLDYDTSRPHPVENSITDIEKAEVNREVVDFLLSVGKFWLREFDIDGFRLDVPNEVPFWFWEIFRQEMKQVKSDIYLVGEIWHEPEKWVNECYFDAVMNYKYFREPVMHFFAMRQYDAVQFEKELLTGLAHYPYQNSTVMMNLLDCHDTHRFLQSVKENDSLMKLAILFQMTFVGIPHIFYGDEIGTLGGNDPENRRPMNWNYENDEQAVSLKNYYSELIKIRKRHPALRLGKYVPYLCRGKLIAFWRVYNEEKILVVINNENRRRKLALPREVILTDLIRSADYRESLSIAGYSGLILKHKKMHGN